MKIIKLVISAFGPYPKLTEIDMELLSGAGVYLITGDTGAGKTTIFDALVFALYGELSGENRRPDMMRSKYADEGTPTFVELTFDYGGKRYVVKRNPEYLRPAKKGAGFTKEPASAELKMPDGSLVTRLREVNEKIEDITGLDRSRFSQVAMIAQGDFLKLLLASTAERSEIFRSIFKTEDCKLLQEKLREKSLALKGEYSSLLALIENEKENIIPGENEDEIAAVAELRETPVESGLFLTLADELIAREKEEFKRLNEKSEKLEKEKENLAGKIESIYNYNSAVKNEEKAQKICGGLQEKTQELLKRFEAAQKRAENLGSLKEEKIKLENNLKAYDEIEKKRSVLNGEISKEKSLRSALGKEKAELEKEKENFAKLRQEASLAPQEKVQLTSLENMLEKAEKRRAEIKKLADDFKEYESTMSALESEQKKYLAAYDKSEKLRAEYLNFNKAFLDSQAGILAEGLKDGEPCPVCGSLTHPSKAHIVNSGVNEAQVEKARADYEAAALLASRLSAGAGELKGASENSKKKIGEAAASLFGAQAQDLSAEFLKEKLSLAADFIDENQKKFARLEALLSAHEKSLAGLPSQEEKITSAGERISALSAQLLSLEEKNMLISRQINEELSRLPFKEKASAENKINELENEIKVCESSLESARKNYEKANENLLVSKTELRQAKELVSSLEKPERGEDEILILIKENDASLAAVKKRILSLHSCFNQNEKTLKKIRSLLEKLKAKEEQIKIYSSMADTATGKLTGKEKLTLEAYAQAVYFERILARANVRLMLMSAGQYELARQSNAENNRSQTGLEIDIIDHYNATKRSVKSLSGGESFKAALSLALGLSDEIQAQSGGIRLESMFIDEGFGSLDEESLRLATDALISLAGPGKSIGIISHVPALKERIDKKIIVTKHRDAGSTVAIEY